MKLGLIDGQNHLVLFGRDPGADYRERLVLGNRERARCRAATRVERDRDGESVLLVGDCLLEFGASVFTGYGVQPVGSRDRPGC